ncbi:MAG: helix-turn-helix domain-containing protein [Bacteroidales bacterium]|nr:helix-turn-helix domain-containing protein [Bacteroidales bacterium]
MPKQPYTLETLPETITAQHISDYLGISRRKVYDLLREPVEKGGIPNFEIGMSRRVIKQDFIEWINARKHEKARKTAS